VFHLIIQSLLLFLMNKQCFCPLMVSQILVFYFKFYNSSSCNFNHVVLPLSSSFSSYNFLMSILFFYSASTLFFLQISTLCLYPFWKSLSLSNSSYNTAFSFSLVSNLFFKVFTCKLKFPIFRFIIAMVWNNLVALSTFIIFVATSSIDFGVLVYVVWSPYPSTNDPRSYTILLPISNSNGNPFVDSGLLGGTYSFTSLNFSKAGCMEIFSVCSSVACRPFYVCYCCCCKCCCKCWKYFGFAMVSIQSSHTSPLKCRFFHPLETLCHVPF